MYSISVVIPLYNKEKYIVRALDSVMNQTCQKFEILVVDDGSTDQGANIVRSYKDKRIRLFTQNNSGVSAARNRGIHEARFEYIAFLDADDEWERTYLDTIVGLIQKYPQAGAYATNHVYILNDGRSKAGNLYGIEECGWEGIILDYFKCASAKGSDLPLCTSALVVSKKVFESIGYFAVGEPLGEDQDLYAKLALKFPIAFSNIPKSYYYKGTDNSACDNNFVKGELPVIATLKEAIADNTLAKDMKRYLKEYLAKCYIDYCYRLIRANRSKEARKILLTLKTRIYTYEKYRLLIVSYSGLHIFLRFWVNAVKGIKKAGSI